MHYSGIEDSFNPSYNGIVVFVPHNTDRYNRSRFHGVFYDTNGNELRMADGVEKYAYSDEFMAVFEVHAMHKKRIGRKTHMIIKGVDSFLEKAQRM